MTCAFFGTYFANKTGISNCSIYCKALYNVLADENTRTTMHESKDVQNGTQTYTVYSDLYENFFTLFRPNCCVLLPLCPCSSHSFFVVL